MVLLLSFSNSSADWMCFIFTWKINASQSMVTLSINSLTQVSCSWHSNFLYVSPFCDSHNLISHCPYWTWFDGLEWDSVSFHYNISHTYLVIKLSLDLCKVDIKLFHKNLCSWFQELETSLASALIWWRLFEKNIFWAQTTKLFKFNLKPRISFSEYLKRLSEKHR